VQLGDLALGDREDKHDVERELLAEPRHVFLITRRSGPMSRRRRHAKLRKGDIAINLSSHKGPKVRQPIEPAGRPMAPKASFRPSIKACFGRSASMKVSTSRLLVAFWVPQLLKLRCSISPPAADILMCSRALRRLRCFRRRSRMLALPLSRGQIGNLAGASVLSAARQIHSVEARHASSVRLVVGKSGSEGAFDKPMSKNEVLEAVKPFFV
jgi:hypothetical protein